MNKMEVAESEERYIREAQLCTFTSIKIINENGKEDIPFIKTVGSWFLKFFLADYSFQSFGKSWKFESSMLAQIQISFKDVH